MAEKTFIFNWCKSPRALLEWLNQGEWDGQIYVYHEGLEAALCHQNPEIIPEGTRRPSVHLSDKKQVGDSHWNEEKKKKHE